MGRPILKNLLIGLFGALFLFQLVFLWVNFEPNTFSKSNSDRKEIVYDKEAIVKLLKPQRILMKNEDEMVKAAYAYHITDKMDEVKTKMDQLIADIVKNSTEKKEGIISPEEVAEKFKFPFIHYEFGYPLPIEAFGKIYGSGVDNQALSYVTELLLYYDEGVYLYVLKDDLFQSFELSMEKPPVFDELKDYGINYIYSTTLEEKEAFARNMWVPALGNDSTYVGMMVENLYETQGDLLLSGIEKQVDVFFDFPSNKQTKNTVPYTFSDDKVVVKYTPEHVLEYACYDQQDEVSDSFLTAVSLVLEMIEKDAAIINEVYIDRYEKSDNGYVFYLNYATEEFPIIFSEYTKQETNLTHMIEMRVYKGVVTYYKKYAKSFTLDITSQYEGKANYKDAMEKIIFLEGEESHFINNFDLGYRTDEEYLRLYWQINTFTMPIE